MAQNQLNITILLHCTDLPGTVFEGRTAIRLGVQKGKAVVDDVAADVESITFICPMRVERGTETGKPNFLGPFAQGTREERFIYLSWGGQGQTRWEMFRRAKIQLKDIPWTSVEQAAATEKPIEATIRMTDKRGGPLCASVKKEFITWTL